LAKKNKELSEKKHRMVQNFLVNNFPGCEIKYNGVEGVDHQIKFNNRIVFIETKTCQRTIRGGVKRVKDRPVLIQKWRFGRFQFYQRKAVNYKKSQHQDLLDVDGWYIFVVDNRVRGAKACDVDRVIHGDWVSKLIVWDKIIFICHPDWLQHLKSEVYEVMESKFGKAK
jgi:hypothetical protein